MTTVVVSIFLLVYLGMILAGVPLLQLDRTGVALLGAIALITFDAVSLRKAAAAVHLPTLILFFSFMVLSAQMRLAGFYSWVPRAVAIHPLSPPWLLGALVFAAAALSAVFSNDIVCLACAPVLLEVCLERGLDPVPFLLPLARAANVGSAATIIGNPQNMLIGQTLSLSFNGYFGEAALPVILSLFATWALIGWQTRGRWSNEVAMRDQAVSQEERYRAIALDVWQTVKGAVVAVRLLLAFVFAPWPRKHVALTAAGFLLMSRRLHSNRMLGLVDWELLVLFIGLFIVNDVMRSTGLPAKIIADLAASGFDLHDLGPLFTATFLLSNVVSNVPAVMLLLPLAMHAMAGPMLALVSTLAGNLVIVGSIANIIVVEAAGRRSVRIDWRRHARTGIPVTLASLAICAIYLWVRVQLWQ